MKHAREGAEFADVALQNERDEWMTERTGEADEETDIVKRRSTKNEAARTGGVSPPFKQGFLLWHESRILGHPSNHCPRIVL